LKVLGIMLIAVAIVLVESGEGIESSQQMASPQPTCSHVESGEGIESLVIAAALDSSKKRVESGEGIES